jgi:hypothetical protein
LGLNKNKSIWCDKIKQNVLFLSYRFVNDSQENKMQENIVKVQIKEKESEGRKEKGLEN